MKTLYFALVLIFSLIVYGTGVAHGEQLVPKTLTELYLEYQGKLVITGQILSASEIPQKNLTSYDIKIQNYITRPQQGSVITAVSPKNDSNSTFNVNDKVQLYLDKNSAGYVISPYSFKMSGSCSSFGPSYADFGPLSGDAAASIPFRFTDSQGNTVSPIVGQPNRMSYDVFNDLPLNKTTVDLNITLDGNPVPVFHDTKYLDLKPCTGTTLTWNFVPAQMGNYTAIVKQTFGIYDNKIILGNYTIANYGFSPSQTHVDNSLLPPLEQFRSGIAAKDVKCSEGFQIVWKTEDGSPACVRSETAQKLVEREWAQPVPPVTEKKPQEILLTTNANNTKNLSLDKKNQSVEVVSVQMIPPTNPGGPRIQLTLMNIGVTPITSLNATLHLNNDYNFDFQDVTKSHPLVSGNSTSYTKILIGGGFTSEATYPLTVNGITNNIPFSFTQNVSIPYTNENIATKITPENVCGKFFTAPGNQTSFNTVPVLLMDSNSTACAKLTFTIISDYKDCNGQSCQHLLEFNSTLPIGNLHYEKHGSMISVSSGKDYTNSFKITAIPETIDLANYPMGANFTVTYIIKPLSNATGFYDQSIPKLACERYPLAVGHTADQVNASDFSYIDPFNPPCAAGSYVLTGVEISSMDHKEVTLRLSTLG